MRDAPDFLGWYTTAGEFIKPDPGWGSRDLIFEESIDVVARFSSPEMV